MNMQTIKQELGKKFEHMGYEEFERFIIELENLYAKKHRSSVWKNWSSELARRFLKEDNQHE